MSDPSTIRPPSSQEQNLSLSTRLADEMRARWQQGERPSTEAFLQRHPGLQQQSEVVVRLVCEEFRLRRESGEVVLVADFLSRFPQWRAQLKVLLNQVYSQHSTRQPAAPAWPETPRIGEFLDEYRILAELGRGSLGCVFLAAEAKLADRRVVLKVTPRLGHEHLSLARLQHTHIVPLYAVHEDRAANRRLLCMPYYGGAALNQILDYLDAIPLRQRGSQHLIAALDRLQVERLATLPHQPTRNLLERLSYVQTACWLGACLADALQFAHAHGLVHLDVKPGNVLLTAGGQPMLLDFHLAQQPLSAGMDTVDWLGGTPSYMAPEQREGLRAVNRQQPLPRAIDGRADVYALGVLLYEMLGGTVPSSTSQAKVKQSQPRRLDRVNPQVSVGLADIVGKCLRTEAEQRYQSAGALAADLRRHLDHLPLRGVPNRNLRERWRKWRRRRPHALRVGILGLAVLVAAVALALFTQDQSHRDQKAVADALNEGRQALRQRDYGRAADRLAQGLAQAESLKLTEEATTLRTALQTARRAQMAQHLHALVDRLRFLVGGSSVTGDWSTLQPQWRAAWEKRHLLVEVDTEAEPGQTEQVRTDLLDLATLWADLRLEPTKGRISVAVARELLEVLDEAETRFGSSAVLAQQRVTCLMALGRVGEANTVRAQGQAQKPQSAWEHCALGRSLLRAGQVSAAAVEFRRALELRPQDFWANFYDGMCAYRLNDATTAVAAFRTCVALAPERAEVYYNRGLALATLGRKAEALADYTRALALEPQLAAAALNRGILHLQEKHFPQARADLERARLLGVKPAVVSYHLALTFLGQQQREAAVTHLQRALAEEPEYAEARALLNQLIPKPLERP